MARIARQGRPRAAGALAFALSFLLGSTPLLALPGTADCIESTARPVVEGGTNGVVAVTAADLDADGDVDLVSASANDDTIAWFENDGGSPPGFTAHVITTGADGATAVTVGDLDHDGLLDVVSASANDRTIAWYQNDGETPPRFIERVVFIGTGGPSSVFVVDVDKDGHMDVVSASANTDEIAWYESDGGSIPGFTQHVISTTADGVASVFAVDLNPGATPADNYPDVLSASRLDDTIAWYEQVFTPAKPEVPANGDIPAIPATPESRTFTKRVISTGADGANSVIGADLDKDGDIDVASASINDDEIAWYESSGTASPSFTKHVVATDADGAASVFAADLDGDTDVDLLSASQNDGKIAWYESNGATPPSFTEHVIATNAPGARSALAASVDPGGALDVVSASSVPGPIAANDLIAWYENNGGGPPAFTQRTVSTGSMASDVILAVDVDGDLDTDILSGSTLDDSIVWFDSSGGVDPAFTRRVVATNIRQTSALDWSDVNGDGKTDVLSASAGDDEIAWHENNGATPPVFTEHVIALAEGASSVDAADVDGDGDMDVLSASFDDDTIAWYENGGGLQPSFTRHVVSATANGARSVFAVDLDVDGHMDILSVSSLDNTAAWYQQGCTVATVTVPSVCTFTQHVLSTATMPTLGARWIGAADIDGDLDLDVLVASSDDDTISWFEHTKTEAIVDPPAPEVHSFTSSHTITDKANFVRQAGAIDLDHDGDLDVFAASSGDNTLSWYENLRVVPSPEIASPGAFETHFVSTTAKGARSAAAANIGGDVEPDLVVAFQFGIEWHAGNGVELCDQFDADGDQIIDGTEIVRLGAAFADFCADPAHPEAEWWQATDVNKDCLVDGQDLAILTGSQVWGKTTVLTEENKCRFICR